MIGALEKVYNLEEYKYKKFNLKSFSASDFSKKDILDLSYQIFYKFSINYLSVSSIWLFENKFYDWVFRYMSGVKMPTNLNMIRGKVLEKYLLVKSKNYDDLTKLKEDAIKDFETEVKEASKEELGDIKLVCTEEEVEDAKNFILNTLHINFEFFKEREFYNQSTSIMYQGNFSVPIYGIIDSFVKVNGKNGETSGIVELKTTERIPKEPSEAHIRQLGLYMVACKDDIRHKDDSNLGYLYYVGASKYMKKGSVRMRVFVFKREEIENYIVSYFENAIYKMSKFLLHFDRKENLIDIAIPQYTSFMFDKNYRDLYGKVFNFNVEKPVPSANYEMFV